MSTPANVHSLEAIHAVRTALGSFADQVSEALTELEGEMRRVKEWLELDRPRYWRTQVRLAIDGVHEAQQALQRCLMFPVGNERPSCHEERAALKKAQARQAYCEAKLERVRHWQRSVQHELFEYEGRISQLQRVVEVEAPQAMGVLAKIVRHLEEYQSLPATRPRTAYNAAMLAQELWPEGAAVATPTSEADRDDKDGSDASGNDESPAEAQRPRRK
jgi:hypothetical protein